MLRRLVNLFEWPYTPIVNPKVFTDEEWDEMNRQKNQRKHRTSKYSQGWF